ncbi:efflux RND transporter permease subunit [bacterium]|nr:efflux RND transporter permease subunit [bacterium]
MSIITTAIRRGVTFFMVYIIAVGFGLFSLSRLKIDLWPSLEFPVVAIITQYTGVGPYDIESVVTRPIEESVAAVQNIKTVSSTSKQGLSLVLLEFEWGTDMDQAEIDVRTYLDFVEDYLPDDISDPLVFAFDPSMQPIMMLSIGSDQYGMAELRRIAEQELEPRLERIPGVASVNTSGGLKREIKVLVDPVRLRAHHISIQQISSALQMNNLQLPSGWIDDDFRELTIQTEGEYQTIEQIENTNIAVINGSVIRVRDVADVVDGFVDQRQRVLVNDQTAVMAVLQKQSVANTVSVSREVRSRFGQILSELPKGLEIETIWDQAEFINRSMSNLGNTALEAIFLAFLVLLFFLRNIRSSLIVSISIPVSMVVTFAVMDQAGLTLNIISMAGLALAVGLLVDNSIVVLESIYRHREEGKSAREAADIGSSEVAMAITASTLTTISVFVPVLFVPGLAGQMFRDMVLTICFSLAVSLVVALTLVPLLASRIVKVRNQLDENGFLMKVSDRIGVWIDNLKNAYLKSLKWALGHKKIMMFSTLGALVLSVFMLIASGGEFLPESDQGYLQLAVDRSAGTSLHEMEKSVHQLNKLIEEYVPEAVMVYDNFGQGEGIVAAFSSSASYQGEIMVKLLPRTQRKRSLEEIQEDIRARVEKIPDVKVSFEDRGAAIFFGGGGDIAVKIFGHDLDIAEVIAKQIMEKVKKVENVTEVEMSIKESSPELRVQLDRMRIADLGLSTAQIGQVISSNILGSVATRFREGGDEYDVRVQLKDKARENFEDIGDILLMTPLGRQVPLRSIAEITYDKAPPEIAREDQERLVTVSISVTGQDLRTPTNRVRRILADMSIPNDFRLEIGGTAEDMMESFMYLGIAFLVAMILTYMVMASQFESLIDPFIILFTVPLSVIGVALGLFLTGTTLSVMAMIGIIMLVGIIVNNGIVLVDYINQLRERGMEMYEAIVLAGDARMRPVLMTALTTILAMVPLALGLGESGENWAPMARSVIGGLLVGTILTLLIVPVVYSSVEKMAEQRKVKRAARKEKKRKH